MWASCHTLVSGNVRSSLEISLAVGTCIDDRFRCIQDGRHLCLFTSTCLLVHASSPSVHFNFQTPLS